MALTKEVTSHKRIFGQCYLDYLRDAQIALPKPFAQHVSRAIGLGNVLVTWLVGLQGNQAVQTSALALRSSNCISERSRYRGSIQQKSGR